MVPTLNSYTRSRGKNMSMFLLEWAVRKKINLPFAYFLGQLCQKWLLLSNMILKRVVDIEQLIFLYYLLEKAPRNYYSFFFFFFSFLPSGCMGSKLALTLTTASCNILQSEKLLLKGILVPCKKRD